MSVQLEVERLRFSLSRSQLPNNDIQNICDAATKDINEVLLDIVSNAVNEAIDYALEIEANDFIDDVQVLPDADGLYRISTHSGILDYSKDSQQMLPKLLQNAKTSKDGHKYKVIPIPKKEIKVEHSMFSVLQARQDAVDTARAALREQATNRKLGIAEALRTNLSQQVAAAHTSRGSSKGSIGGVEFKTVSDKQDASKSWVIPEKSADMTDYIDGLNRRMADTARSAIEELLESYYTSYME
jgi:hypothetical protein